MIHAGSDRDNMLHTQSLNNNQKMSKIILVSLLARVKTVLCFTKCLIIAIPEILTSIEVMYSLAFCFFTIDVDVFLLDGLLRDQ